MDRLVNQFSVFFSQPNSSFDDFALFFFSRFVNARVSLSFSLVMLCSELRVFLISFFFVRFVQKFSCMQMEKVSKKKISYCSQQTMDRKLHEKLRIVCFFAHWQQSHHFEKD